jgi:hypothetical protein
MPELNNHPLGESLPNLVALLESDRRCALSIFSLLFLLLLRPNLEISV